MGKDLQLLQLQLLPGTPLAMQQLLGGGKAVGAGVHVQLGEA